MKQAQGMRQAENARAKRDEERAKRTEMRRKLRKGAKAAAVLVALAFLCSGCNSAQPLSKGQTSKACGNTVTVSLTFIAPTNALTLEAGAVTVSLSDVIGTQTMSADAGTSDTTSQTAMPTMPIGLVGDKPIEAAEALGAAALTGGVSQYAATAASAVSTTNSTAK